MHLNLENTHVYSVIIVIRIALMRVLIDFMSMLAFSCVWYVHWLGNRTLSY